MAVSSKDLETLWQRYKVEAVPASTSVNQFFESNGIPYHALYVYMYICHNMKRLQMQR
jgi:hypothetical protein